jgi:hypothetical protein
MKELSKRLSDLEQRLDRLNGEEPRDAEVTELRPKQGPSSAGG